MAVKRSNGKSFQQRPQGVPVQDGPPVLGQAGRLKGAGPLQPAEFRQAVGRLLRPGGQGEPPAPLPLEQSGVRPGLG